jgi:hypothetical protein
MSELEIDTPSNVYISAPTELTMPDFDRFVHTDIPLISSHFSLGVQHVISVSDNRLYACGSNDEKKLGIADGANGPRMTLVTEFVAEEEVKIVKIGTSDTCSFVLMDDFTIWGFGTLRVCFLSVYHVVDASWGAYPYSM